MTMGKNIKTIIEEDFLRLLKEGFGDNLVSVCIYGSYVSGNFVKGVSDINLLILLENSSAEQLTKFGSLAHKIMKRHKITPLILTKKEFINSADVFPLEYFDIKERNQTIYGEDETKNLALTRKNLRHQLEDRLRGDVATLRQLIIAARGKNSILGRYLKNWYGSLNALFKGLLRLKGVTPVPMDSEEILQKLSEAFQLDTKPFSDVINLRKGVKVETRALAHAILSSLERLIGLVDTMEFKEQ
jgi:predicted nucleotidyltransferase